MFAEQAAAKNYQTSTVGGGGMYIALKIEGIPCGMSVKFNGTAFLGAGEDGIMMFDILGFERP